MHTLRAWNLDSSAPEHILKEQGKKERFARETTALLKAFSLALPSEKAMQIKEEVGLFSGDRRRLAVLAFSGPSSRTRAVDVSS